MVLFVVFPERFFGETKRVVWLFTSMPAPYWIGSMWQGAPNMPNVYGPNQFSHDSRMACASVPDCLCVSEDCCFEDGHPTGFCGRKHLFQSEEALVTCISNYINRRVSINDQDVQLGKLSTIFHAVRPPSIAVLDYLLRMFKYAFCSRSCFVTAIVYLERLAAKGRAYQLTCLNVHRLLITSLMLAAKYLDDIYYNNAYYAKVGGVSLGEMNLLEIELLEALNFSLAVNSREYFQVENMLITEAWSCESASQVLAANDFVPYSLSQVDNSGGSRHNTTSNVRTEAPTNPKHDSHYRFPSEYVWRPIANPVEYNLFYHGRYYISQKPPPGFDRVYSSLYSGNVGYRIMEDNRLIRNELSAALEWYPNGVSPVTPECVQVGPPQMFQRPSARTRF